MKARLFILAAALLLLCLSLNAQSTTHSVTLNVNSDAPGTATVFRAQASCPTSGVPSSGTALTTSLAVTGTGTSNTATFTDNTVQAGTNYCFWATLQTAGGGSGVSNTFLGAIPVSVSLSGKVQ